MPGKNGTPHFDLSKDPAATVESENLTYKQILLERVIRKTFKDRSIPLNATDTIRNAFSSKLWRMGKCFATLGSKRREAQLLKWKEGPDAVWTFTVGESEINKQLLHRKRSMEEELHAETTKRRCLEVKVDKLQTKVKQQAQVIINTNVSRKKYLKKPLADCSRQQQYNRKKKMIKEVNTSLSVCKTEGYDPQYLEIQSKETGNCEVIDLSGESVSDRSNKTLSIFDKSNRNGSDYVHSSLYVKDKFGVSNEAYHELSMLSDLPSISKVKRLSKSLNSQFGISATPNNIIGVQQSVKARILQRLTILVSKNVKEGINTPSTIRIKLTGDGTQIGRGLNVVNIAFTIIDEGEKAQSVLGNYSIAILKITENYTELAAGLEDICKEAQDLKWVTINDKAYKITFFLGGDLKFLAMSCGIEAANSEHACVWCKCPKSQRGDMKMEWSLTDQSRGARTIDEITEKSKLGKRNKSRYNCCHIPLFPFIPIDHVVIDTLHLFLRISDNLIDLLIRDLRIQDSMIKNGDITNLQVYETHLNEVCKVRFKWSVDKDSKELKYRDLTGTEKVRLFKNTDISMLFPMLPKGKEIQEVWFTFFQLVNDINSGDSEAEQIDCKAKTWVTRFKLLYQSKDVTPYMHALAMHVSEFIHLYGNLVAFTQQGLEKLNDITTKQFQRSTNHRDISSLKQILEKRNRIELLEDDEIKRVPKMQVCSICKLPGHNRKTCKA